jgi:hypothetical protein
MRYWRFPARWDRSRHGRRRCRLLLRWPTHRLRRYRRRQGRSSFRRGRCDEFIAGNVIEHRRDMLREVIDRQHTGRDSLKCYAVDQR